jgi:hypothetical protein
MHADNVPQDIIFSIRIINHADNFNLTSISITIPMGVPITSPSQNPGPLTQAYTGPGATMLSNLRFNPLVSNDTDTNSLVITLIPRSLQGFVELASQTELNFMLSSVVVNYSPNGPATVFVRPTISEKLYQPDPVAAADPGAADDFDHALLEEVTPLSLK